MVTTLTGVYIYSYSSLGYFENNPVLKARFERKKNLISLAKKLEDIAAADKTKKINQRNVAAISGGLDVVPKEPEFITKSNVDIIDANELAKKYYHEAKIKCYEPNRETDCLSMIEIVVTHFPESDWTAESLMLLTEFYYRTNRTSSAHEILEILKLDFKNNESIQKKVAIIERHFH